MSTKSVAVEIRCGRHRAGRASSSVALSVIAALSAAPALAESSEAESADQRASAGQSNGPSTALEEIVVTAERRTTDVQKTSLPVTVLTGEDLRKKGVDSVDGLQFTTPSLNIQDSGDGAIINIRGIGKSDFGQQVPAGILIYRDGVPVAPGGILADEPYYDIASIEVLRGPQGTFAGENSTGGAIFIKEVDPSLVDGFGGWVEGQYGNYNDARVRGALNLPLSDTLALRFAANGENRDTFWHMTGPYTGNPGKHHEADGRLSVLWQPTEAFKALLKMDYNYIDHGGIPASPYTYGSTANLFNVASDAYLRGIENQSRTVLQLNYLFDGGITLRSIGSYQSGRVSSARDVDGTANPLLAKIYRANSRDRTISEELNLVSPDAGRLTWVLGGTYLQDTVTQPTGGSSLNFLSLSPGGTPTAAQGITIDYRAKKKNWGMFGQGTYELTDALKLQIGARYSSTSFVLDNLTQLFFFGHPVLGENVVGDEARDSRTTGKVGLDWSLNKENFLYAFVATGHKGGGINGVGIAAPIIPPGPPPAATGAQLPPKFAPEEVTDYEVGWKGTYFGNRLHTQLGAFYNAYRNFQVALFDPNYAAGQVENATGTTRIEGLEAQAQGQFGGFSFDVGASYLETSIGNFLAIDSRHLGTGLQDLTGKQQPNAPRWTAQAGVQYLFHVYGSDTLSPRLDYGMVGSRWATIFEVPPGDYLSSQSLFNAQLTYTQHNNWQVTAYATNLFDRRYVSTIEFANLAIAGPPRQFGLRVSKSF
jgi:iron complex outermembrane receptor protein